MKYNEKLEAMIGFVEENFKTAAELVEWLEMSVEDVVQCFPDALVNSYEKVFPMDLEELDQQSDEGELTAWNGVEVFGLHSFVEPFSPFEDVLENE